MWKATAEVPEAKAHGPLARKKSAAIFGLSIMLSNPVHAGKTEAERTVESFYSHIARKECEAAVALAEKYSVEKCRRVEGLELGSIREIENRGDTATVHVSVTIGYQENIINTCKGTLPLSRISRRWRIDFGGKAFACAFSNTKAASAANSPELPAPSVGDRPPSPPPARTQPAAPPVPPATEGLAVPERVSHGPATALLGTFRPEELQGQPGDERIIELHPPDRNPPQQRTPGETLPELAAAFRNSIRRVRLPEGRKLAALTFDLCEQADDRTGYDRNVVNFLRTKRIHATFFAGGKWLRSHEDKALQIMADPLFEIGNHGWTHGNLRVLRGQRMLDQIIWTQAEYNRLWHVLDRKAKAAGLEGAMRAIPRQPRILRFPYGTCDAASLHAANQQGLSAIQWDVVSGDASSKATPDAVARAVLGSVKPGSIIVFHANGRGYGTAGALPRIVESLRAKGYEFTTVSDLLKAGEPEAVDQCYEMRPGDNQAIDAAFGEGTGDR